MPASIPIPSADLEVPQFLPIPAQAAAVLKRGLSEGVWHDYLPSERKLCELLQISRPSVRAALHQLAQEGLIETKQGRQNRITVSTNRPSPTRSRSVVIIMHEPFYLLASNTYQSIAETRAHLIAHGFTIEVFVCPPGPATLQCRKLDVFVHRRQTLCYVLLSVNFEVQQWFASRHIPALVLGSCYENVKLPSLDVDYRSVCRHAAANFIRKGHRRIALVVPNSGMAGDYASEQGFIESAEPLSLTGEVAVTIVRHTGRPQSISSRLDSVFEEKTAPTALLAVRTEHVLQTLTHLLSRGIAVPKRVSLVARDQDHFLDYLYPKVSHYRFNDSAYEHRLTRLLMQLVNRGELPPIAHLIFPDFIPGGTFQPPAATSRVGS